MVAQMLVTVNQVDPGGENKIVVLNDLQKNDILKQLTSLCIEPDKYFLAVSQELPAEYEPEPSDYWTLSEYLEAIGLEVTVPERQRINYYLTKLFKQHYGRPSRVVYRSNPGDSRRSIKLSGYAPSELWVIKEAIKQAMGLEVVLEKDKEPMLKPVEELTWNDKPEKRKLPI